jgi:hypothetical protein
MNEIKITKAGDQILVESPYLSAFVSGARRLNGKWTGSSWSFGARHEERVRDLCRTVYGTDGEDGVELVTVRVTMEKQEWDCVERGRYAVSLEGFGRVLATAKGRDSGAVLGEGVVIVEGAGFISGGSRKNFAVGINSGSVFEVENVPLPVATQEHSIAGGKVEVIRDDGLELESLLLRQEIIEAELDGIKKRIAELKKG